MKKTLLILSAIVLFFAGCKKDTLFEEGEVLYSGIINGYKYINLGLPSGLKWATCNVGATSAEDYGDYFAWGETSPKAEYDWDTYLHWNDINGDGWCDNGEATINSDISGNAQYDAATANWGGSWRMPTKEEQQELIDNCTWRWTTQNGVKGYKVTGPNGNHIFLPAAGWRNGTSLINDDVDYWSSTPNDYSYGSAYGLFFYDGAEYVSYIYRGFGLTVRPVSGENKIQLPTVTTNDVTNITTSSATCGGNVTSDGGFDITARGVCWSTNPNPTINDNKTSDGSGTGSFTSNLINLTENTAYYFRAYATNEKGTSYGEEKSFKTLDNQEITVNGVSFTMIKVEGCTFNMGAQSTDPSGTNYDGDALSGEEPVHSVTLSDYYIGETEVTQELWEAVMGSNPSYFSGYPQRPVEVVSWNDCQEFITKLNELTGMNFRLPTEAEWEYAARGGDKSKGYKYSGSNTIGNVAWYRGNSGSATHNVKTKSPNELGIYDMSGNVREWCEDWYGNYSSGSQTNSTGPSSGSYRVLRGGSWGEYAEDCRVSNRFSDYPDYRNGHNGFRLALSQ